MAATLTSTEYDAMFKEVYSKDILSLVPEQLKIQRMAPLSEDGLVGDKFVQPVCLSYEHGITHLSPSDDDSTIRASIASAYDKVEIEPNQYVIRSRIGYNALFRAAKAGKQAFKTATSQVTMNMTKSLRKRLEIDMLYGKRPVGTVAGLSSQVIEISEATWAPGIWAGSKNAVIDVYQSDGTTLEQGDLVISSVDMTNRKLTVVGTTTNISSGDLVYFDTANVDGTLNTMVGLEKITNTTSGDLFGVSAANELWQAQRYDAAGPLTMRKIMAATNRAVELGLEEDVVCLIPSKAYEVLNSNEAALRDYDKSYSRGEAVNGVRGIKYEGQFGTVSIVPHTYLKQGQGFLLNPKDIKRIYTTDLTFERPGTGGSGGIFHEVVDKTSYEMRAYMAQGFFLENPAHLVEIYGITY